MIEGIFGAQQNFQVNNTAKANRSASNSFSDVNFRSALVDVARAANISVADSATAGQLEFTRQKEGYDDPFNFQEAEDELMEDYITRIRKMMDRLKK